MGDEQILTDAHYIVFGRIVTLFARAEDGFRTVLAMLLGIPMRAVLLMCAPYGAQDIRNVVKSTAKITLAGHPRELETLLQLLGDHQALSRLRNHISHSRWQRGSLPLSVRPVYGDVRRGKFLHIGVDDESVEYDTDELTRLHNLAISLNARLHDFVISEGFELALAMRERM